MTQQPRWLIDDTTRPGHVVCTHTREPRLAGEIVSPDDLPENATGLAAPGGNWLVVSRWIDGEPSFYEEQDMYDSLEAALKEHEASKGTA